MSPQGKKTAHHEKGVADLRGRATPLALAAVGLEAEFSFFVDERPVKPETLFRDPQHFIRPTLVHREGTSYHLPTGGAVYFDTGVIEVATPVIEIERGCAARAGRSLWESIHFLRTELDAWERRSGRHARLAGFSTHYNISFSGRSGEDAEADFARLLTYILPVPVALLAANRRSTGIGVRPRGNRIEVTADFTPSASLMIAAATFMIGVAREVMTWPSYAIEMLDERRIPVIVPFRPRPHTSRKGWLARYDCFPANPFKADVDEDRWAVRPAFFRGKDASLLSLRTIARQIFFRFRPAIRSVADPFTYRLLTSIIGGRAPILLELDDRPAAYDDVGRLCMWDNLFPERMLTRSRYERVLIHALSGKKLRLNGSVYRPVGMRGWSEVVFVREEDGSRHSFPIDFLVRQLGRTF